MVVSDIKQETIFSTLVQPLDEQGQISNVYWGDCVDFMRNCADNEFDLAICDPPYGIGKDWKKRNKGAVFQETSYQNEQTPTQEYFDELKRVSKHQIIWGYNYFTQYLGSTNYLIVCPKQSSSNKVFHYSKCEIAYTDIHIPCNLVSIEWDGYRMGKERGKKKIHPHQKPIELYEWLLNNYGRPENPRGFRVFDSHLGSGSSRIAAWKLGYDFVGCEIDDFYYQRQEERFNEYIKKSVSPGKEKLLSSEILNIHNNNSGGTLSSQVST